MGFNGISGIINEPGEIPFWIIILYLVASLFFIFYIGKRYKITKSFTTIDYVYIGIGAAFSIVWEFYISGFIGRFVPSIPYIDIAIWGRILIVFITASQVRKPGVGILTLFIFDLLSDIFYYGFGGEPMFFIYEALTYGVLFDLMVVITRGHLFGIGKSDVKSYIPLIQGAILGLLWALPDPIFYDGFFNPFIYGGIVTWGKIIYGTLIPHIPGDVIVGAISAYISYRISKAL